ncbi:restriction endonuclease subunit S [Zhongshania sp.]|jgi:type I restriction enzyme S subunit|uniref:restriction endonuclease subunit S n=1 Tax=Zhongshania sp. TaxID=1971902 RepID=UPI002A83527D|nr:restriction endonuclease subunit S [Zhongshania sp.]
MPARLQISHLFNVRSSKRVLKSQWQKAGVPFFRGREISTLSKTGCVDNELFISEELYLEFTSKYGVPKTGDIVITAIGTIGNSYIVKDSDRFYFKDASVLWLEKKADVDSRFIDLWFKSSNMWNQLDHGKGATVDTLTISKLVSLKIDLPPLPEQNRIVALLDSAFADIDKARANAEQNLENARELFESFLSQTFSASGPSAKNTNLGNEINLLTGFAFKSPEYSKSKSDTPLIRGDNIIQGKLRWDDAKYWPSDKVSDYEKYFLDENDIVLAMDRTWVKSGIKYAKISPADLPCLLVQRVARLRCKSGILHDYLYYLIGSKKFEAYVLSIQTGLGVPHISGKQIQAFTFNLPSLEAQAEAVGQFSNIHKLTTDLISIYESKISNLDELKKSLLQKAFTGQLSASTAKTATDGQAA